MSAMKKVEFIVDADLVDKICRSLIEVGIRGIIATDIKVDESERPIRETYRGMEYEIGFVPKVKLEVKIIDSMVIPVVLAISEGASTNRGDNVTLVISRIEKAIRIGTDEIETEVSHWLH